MKQYKCIRDYQGGEWCVGKIDDAKGWLESAISWRDSDGSFESDDERKRFISYWQHKISIGEEWDLIEYVADIWQIGLVEVKE